MPSITNRPGAVRLLAFLLALCGALAFVTRGYHDEREALHFRDFKQPYSSARCLLTHCDSYSEAETRTAFLAAGGVDDDRIVFDPYSALYPPFSLVALLPIAALPYPAAHAVWEALLAATFSIAILLIADLCAGTAAGLLPVLLLAVFAVSSTILLMLGQISGFVIALLVIGFYCLVRERLAWLATLCFFIAVVLKPHDACIPLLYLAFAGSRWRRVFVTVAVLSVVFAAGSVLWFGHMAWTAHWLPELRANLQGNAGPGAVNNPGGRLQGVELTNLQPLFALMRDQASFYNDATFLICAVFLAAWAVPAMRLRNTASKHLPAIAAIACLALLPIYHRQYDTRILLLAFPAVASLLSRQGHRAWGAIGLLLLAAATVLTSHQLPNHLMAAKRAAILHAGAGQTLLLYRPIELSMLVLFCFFTAALYMALRAQMIEDRR